MTRLVVFCATAMLLAALSTDALAQRGGQGPGGQGPGGIIDKMDRDGDGRISADEFRGPPRRFEILDKDGDGYVTAEELGGGGPGGGGRAANHPLAGWYAKLPVILTHSHLDAVVKRGQDARSDWDSAIANAIAMMNGEGVRAAILMPPPTPEDRIDSHGFDQLVSAASRHPKRFRVAGGGWTLNGMIEGTNPDRVSGRAQRNLTERAQEIVTAGGVGFGETTALHFSFFREHPFEETRPDHPLFLTLADLAAKHGVPLDFHMEAVAGDWTVTEVMEERSSANPGMVSENLTAFEKLLSHNRKAKIIWVHLGMDTTGHRTPALTRRLLEKHENLYISISGIWVIPTNSPKTALIKKGVGLNPTWKQVILDFPDRFTIGSDVFFQTDNPYRKMPRFLKAAVMIVRLPWLPPSVARKVAFENAQRIFRLNLIDTAEVPLPGGDGGLAGGGARQRGGAKGFLSKADIRQRIIGNTLNFTVPTNGLNLFIYFAKDGSVALKVAGPGKPIVRKSWRINEKGMLCRTFGRMNKNHCIRVRATGDPDSFIMKNPKVRYQAKMLRGRRLTK